MSSSVTATFIFTDLVDSTATAARLGPDAAEELRQTHFRLLRSAIVGSGGTEVKNLGDGLMVMFSSPSRALAGAVGIARGGVALGEDRADGGRHHFGGGSGTLAKTLRMKWTRQRCQAAPMKTASMADLSPRW